MEFFNNFIDKTLLDRLNNVINSEFGRITYTDAIKKLEENNDNFEIICVNIYTNQKSTGLKEYLESKLSINVNIVED